MTPGDAPLEYFLHSAGPATRPVMVLGWIYAATCAGVCVIVGILLIVAISRRRPQADIYTGEQGLRWIYIGSGISVFVLFGMLVYALMVLNDTSRLPPKPVLTITVTGYQFWWDVNYEDQRVRTANEIHIPAGVPVLLLLKSADVIHNFWVPALAGKTQMIPGQINRQWIQADEPGIYRGQCTEYCGIQHAHMGFEVVAQTMADFEKWLSRQQKPSIHSSAGQHIFIAQCAACHTVRGTTAKGIYGPDLTHLLSRRMIAAELASNTPTNLAEWIIHAQQMKPGVRMPDFDLSPADKESLLNYLETLK